MYLFFKNLEKSLLSLIKLVFISRWMGLHKYRTKNKSCLILGNGPSLLNSIEKYNKNDLKFDLFCVNNFACTPQYEELKPQFYVLQAPQFFKDDAQLSELYIQQRNTLFENIEKKTTWKIYFIIPIKAKSSSSFQKTLANNKFLTPLYFNDTAIEGFSALKWFSFKNNLGLPRPHNVLIPALINAINIGFKNIYIIGADHSWLGEISVNNQNESLVNQKHYYDEFSSKPEKMQDYIYRPRRLHEIINKFYLTFLGYWEIKSFAEKRGVHIYNSSETSMIDAFERVDLEILK
jgi:hypothetical protein